MYLLQNRQNTRSAHGTQGYIKTRDPSRFVGSCSAARHKIRESIIARTTARRRYLNLNLTFMQVPKQYHWGIGIHLGWFRLGSVGEMEKMRRNMRKLKASISSNACGYLYLCDTGAMMSGGLVSFPSDCGDGLWISPECGSPSC